MQAGRAGAACKGRGLRQGTKGISLSCPCSCFLCLLACLFVSLSSCLSACLSVCLLGLGLGLGLGLDLGLCLGLGLGLGKNLMVSLQGLGVGLRAWLLCLVWSCFLCLSEGWLVCRAEIGAVHSDCFGFSALWWA